MKYLQQGGRPDNKTQHPRELAYTLSFPWQHLSQERANSIFNCSQKIQKCNPGKFPTFPKTNYMLITSKKESYISTPPLLCPWFQAQDKMFWEFLRRRHLWVNLCSSETHPSIDHGRVHKGRGSGGFPQVKQLIISQHYAQGTLFAA